ncbi:glycoside hydrolase family 3 N-terminal domain-containing protein [Paenibacillus sp.]|uniref:glycoside hydrolase family 3 protein n=1 Tax=Paenibacillus sp. TaxID=58172 RepID=UPI0028B140ED|nr:glycoside hydrolase family 3 N-terminal domain-containing protein [Paenibacillus sp.]
MDLKAKPFYLQDEDIQWVKNTLDSMDLDAKVGQLFCPLGMIDDQTELQDMLENYQPGGIMYRPGEGVGVQATHRYLQDNSLIPLLVSANLEAGGNGIASEGTYFGKQMQVAATDNEEMGYRLGQIAGREGKAVGCNWAFAPVVDIDMNFRNPITNIRTYGSDPERVLRMGKAYVKGVQENGVAASIKHFPGDGVDDRDQHLHISINSLSVEDWDQTYGMVYKGLIDEGAMTVMIGHIMLPAYSRALSPDIRDEELMPATLSPELLNGLLRDKLGFNGMIVTDAATMAGFTMAMKREIAVPKSIAAGCDMFLFNRNMPEDYKYMKQGIENGILTMEQLHVF